MKSVAISTGHSAISGGAIALNGTAEFFYNRRIVSYVLNLPFFKGEWLLVDKDFDNLPYPDHLIKTVAAIKFSTAVAAVEVHHNACGNPKVKGGMVVYQDDNVRGKQLSDLITGELAKIPGFALAYNQMTPISFSDYRKIYRQPEYKARSLMSERHIGRRLYYLKELTTIAAVIIEPGYLSNQADLLFIENNAVEIAMAIHRGVNAYL